jgi:hypothetical protein
MKTAFRRGGYARGHYFFFFVEGWTVDMLLIAVCDQARPPENPDAVAGAWADLSSREREVLAKWYERSLREEFSLDALAKYDADFEAWRQETDRQHLAECQDPEHCDDAPCRKARGLPPLTREEIRAGLYRVDGHRLKKPTMQR